MLTRIRIRNFKKLEEVDIELGKTVVFVGPNNSGKTTVLQALALWDVGLRQWSAKRSGKKSPEKRSGITINRQDLLSIPVPNANLLWRNLHVRNIERIGGKPKTQNIRIDITVDGISQEKHWSCGLEFDYGNAESFYCRQLRLTNREHQGRMPVAEEALNTSIVFLPPMSGLAAVEPKWEPGRINVLLGEGQTAQVLRNLCYQIYTSDKSNWLNMIEHLNKLFGVKLLEPTYIKERGEITMSYEDVSGAKLDLSSSGRGFQQTLLLLAHLYANPSSTLLLDEPDAHLEVLRQRQTYQLLTEIASKQGSQIIAASHSEVVLNEAADRDIVIAFVGKPHRIDDRGSQLLKSLKEIGYDQFLQAEETGWVLYLEGATDLAILQIFAKKLEHEAMSFLEKPFVHYVATNLPQRARDHFYALREAKNDLVGLSLFDRLDKELKQDTPLREIMWGRKEIENYLCMEEVLLAYARGNQPDNLFDLATANHREEIMRKEIDEMAGALKKLHKLSPWSPDIKATGDFLDPLFESYFERLNMQNLLRKTDYHILADHVPKEKIDPEVIEKLDAIVKVAKKAIPREN